MNRLLELVRRHRTGLIVGAWFLFSGWVSYVAIVQDSLEQLDREWYRERELRAEFETKHAQGVTLEQYRAQYRTMEATFPEFLRSLPATYDAAALTATLAQTSDDAGVELLSVKPGTERVREFYVELPLAVELEGSYTQLGLFAEAVAALPRVLTLNDFVISRSSDDALAMRAEVRAYRYREADP